MSLHHPLSLTRTVLTVLGIAAVSTAAATVVTTAPASADATAAVVRSAHFSPDTAGVDVYLAPFSGGATTLWVSNERYGSISQYQRITPGAYVVSMRPHNAPATTKPTLTWTLNATAGSAYTAAAIGKSASLQAVVLTDQLTPPATGTGRIRIVQAASAAPSVSVVANGGVNLAAKLAFGSTSGYQTVPTGRWDVRATADTGSATPATSSVAVPAGSSSTVVVLDGANGALTLKSVQDSASSGTMPVGSVDTGGGGTATTFAASSSVSSSASSSTPVLAWTGAGALALLVSVGTLAASRRRHAGV